jgi:hypothetical protein
MKNNFKLVPKEYQAGETGQYKDYFLCVDIADKDLPWDVNRTDW